MKLMILISMLLSAACTITETTVPMSLRIEQSQDGLYHVWKIDATIELIYHNGELIPNWCKNFKIYPDMYHVAIAANSGDEICVDLDNMITRHDCEETYIL